MPTSAGNALAKVDASGEERVKVWLEPGCLPGEPLMVPRPHGKEEEERLAERERRRRRSLPRVGADGSSFLLILDASSWRRSRGPSWAWACPTASTAAGLIKYSNEGDGGD